MIKYLVLLLSFIFLSCSIDTHNTIIHNKIKNKINAFIFLRKVMIIEADDIRLTANLSTASGVCIEHKNVKKYHSILSVSHFCMLDEEHSRHMFNALTSIVDMNSYNQQNPNIQISQIIEAIRYDGEIMKATIKKIDKKNDLCLLELENQSCLNTVIIEKNLPENNIYAYNYAAPLSLFAPGSVLTFSGFYAGTDLERDMIFTIPATFGSSGSPVMNSDFRLISIMKLAYDKFNQVSYGINLLSINKFLNDK